MASERVLDEKKKIVSEIKDKVKEAETVVLFDYRGLTDNESKDLRKELRDNDSDYKIYKNTLLKIALKDLDINLSEYLEGPTAIAFSTDQLSPIRVLSTFAKKHDALILKAGIVDGKVSDENVLKSLASIPSREGLYTMLAGGMIQIAKDLSIALNLYSKQKEN
ncbi:MAG TPA: 50S ribosomal protein L10 [Bacilli bacterium]|nr:50S ribosomal protein L10 [Bacilli bacterium]